MMSSQSSMIQREISMDISNSNGVRWFISVASELRGSS